MAQHTAAARRAERDAAQRAAKIAEFKAEFLADQQRRVYSEAEAWKAREQGDPLGMVLYSLVDDFKRTRAKLMRELDSALESLADAKGRLAQGRDPFWWSNGFTGRYGAEIDQLTAQLETSRKAITRIAGATHWRVREVEEEKERQCADLMTATQVVAVEGGCVVQQTTPDGVLMRLGADGVFVAEGVSTLFATEEAAYAALFVVVNGRPLQ